jgi:hypothetical protein
MIIGCLKSYAIYWSSETGRLWGAGLSTCHIC